MAGSYKAHPDQTLSASVSSASALCEICLCLFIVVCPQAYYIFRQEYNGEQTVFLIVCFSLPLLHYEWGYMRFMCCLFGSGACMSALVKGSSQCSFINSRHVKYALSRVLSPPLMAFSRGEKVKKEYLARISRLPKPRVGYGSAIKIL